MVEKSDEFNECMLNRQNFPYQNFALRKFWYCIFYGYKANLSGPYLYHRHYDQLPAVISAVMLT